MFPPTSRILIVDDMLTMRKLVMKALRELGYSNFLEAADGALAWEAFSSASPTVDLIISDWNMPNASGLDLLKRVRADGRFKNVPFLLVTAESEKAQVVAALSAGVTGYVVKPFDVNALREQITRAAAQPAPTKAA